MMSGYRGLGAVAALLAMGLTSLNAQAEADGQRAVDAAYSKFRSLQEGKNASKPPVDVTTVTMEALVPVARVPPFTLEGQPQSLTIARPAGNGGFSGPALRRGLIVSFGALQALDAHSTLKALKNGGREANPAMSAIASNGAALFAVKAGTVAATAYFAERLSKNHPKRAVVLMALLNSAYVAVVAHNYRVARW